MNKTNLRSGDLAPRNIAHAASDGREMRLRMSRR